MNIKNSKKKINFYDGRFTIFKPNEENNIFSNLSPNFSERTKKNQLKKDNND